MSRSEEELITPHAKHTTMTLIEDEKEMSISYEAEISNCKPLFSQGYEEKRETLLSLLEASG